MQRFYREYYRKYIQALQTVVNKDDRARLTKAYQTAAILFEVLRAVNDSQSVEVDQAIQAAVYALRNTRGLPWPKDQDKKPEEKNTGKDLLDWLQAMFGFQKDNVSNQREHLILLLANVHIRKIPKADQQPKLDDKALDDVMKKLFKNYKKWCKYLGRKSSLWLPTIQQEVQQRKLLYMGLYLLIWGEAANLRFMPECICYIYHHMAFELYGMLAGNVSPMTGENVRPAYGGDEEAFLTKVVTPIYKVIEKEAERSKTMKSKHSHWRNYDDLNEYFCLEYRSRSDVVLSVPFNLKQAKKTLHALPVLLKSIFLVVIQENRSAGNVHWMGKVNFVEIRSFWHIFRSFDRMWILLILSLQAMIIIAWNGGTPSDIFDAGVFKKVLSILFLQAILKLGQGI
ncbi:Callose synthase 3 [Zea mays]|uniref:Callose synthase 3 n=1 Tax=Zea mays TaxID=4577 RepID=A0A3L6F1B1_MAIZE|nr:Callose synthase 3 [Zea mays]